jgi:CheY-like chemotaxis protein
MSVPDAQNPVSEEEPEYLVPKVKPLLSPTASSSPFRGHKRTRSLMGSGPDLPSKFPRLTGSEHRTLPGTPRHETSLDSSTSTPLWDGSSSTFSYEQQVPPGTRLVNIRDVLETLVNDVIKVGGRPESAIGCPIEQGEEIEVRRKAADGSEHVRLVKWTVDPLVPETILVDEKDFAGLISRVLHNAFKFTEDGQITIGVKLSLRGKYIVVNIKDTGIGIPTAFMPQLFKPFSKEDDGITRQSEGLGLGLMVAKGLARRMNGDLYAVRSKTNGPERGTEFEMRIPLTPTEAVSRSGTPFSSPTPSLRLRSTEEISPPQDAGRSKTSPVVPVNILPAVSEKPQEFPAMLTPTSDTHHFPSHYASAVQTPTLLQTTPCHSAFITPVVPTTPLASRLPLSFLVVEDNLLLRRILMQMLHKMGYQRILEAYDGAEALRQMEAHQRRLASGEVDYEIDVVLMDLWMPTMNGYETAERIFGKAGKAVAWKKPVIMAVTADVTDGAIERVASSGMRGPLTKPYTQSDLERNLLGFCSPLTS